MANKKISGFDTISTIAGGPINLSDVLGVAGYCDDPAAPGTDVNVSFSGQDIIDILPVVNDGTLTITLNGVDTTFSANQAADSSVSITTSSDTTYDLGTNTQAAFGEIKLTGSDATNDLVSLTGAGTVSVSSDAAGAITITGAAGSASAFTTLTAADVIDWDYATDGPNIKVTLGAGLENVLTVNTIGEFPDGSEGWLILDPSASVDYRLPDEDEGSAATMQSVITNGDVSLGGTNPVLFHYTYDGSTFYWTKFENMIAPANYPPSVDYDGSDLLIYITPEAFNQATQGQIAGSAVFDNLIEPSNFGDMSGPISPGSGFEFYPRDNATYGAAFWSMGSGTVGIFRSSDLALVNALSNNISYQGYIQGPYSGTFETLVDFDGATNTGSYEQHLYISSGRFRVYNPSTFYSFPELDDYSVDGGANLADAWLFVSFGITAGAAGTATLRVACQASLDAAVAAGGATAWNYNGTGASTGLGPLTVNVDANGIYEEVVSDVFTEANIVNITLGVNNIGGEYGNFHYGLFGIYSKDINLADTTQNWIDTRAIYGIT